MIESYRAAEILVNGILNQFIGAISLRYSSISSNISGRDLNPMVKSVWIQGWSDCGAESKGGRDRLLTLQSGR